MRNQMYPHSKYGQMIAYSTRLGELITMQKIEKKSTKTNCQYFFKMILKLGLQIGFFRILAKNSCYVSPEFQLSQNFVQKILAQSRKI